MAGLTGNTDDDVAGGRIPQPPTEPQVTIQQPRVDTPESPGPDLPLEGSDPLPRQFASPMRQHKRTPSVHREVKETLDARVEFLSDEIDGRTHHRINQYVIQDEMGRGSFGSVHLATDQFGNEYAVKEFSKARLRKRAQSNILRQGPHRPMRFSGLNGSPAPFSRPRNTREAEKNDALYLIREEVAIMKKLDHPNLVSLIEVLDNPEEDSLYMVLEMCKKGVVMKVGLDENVTPYEEETCRYWFRDLILGIEYLHAQGVIHRDIKPDNLLLSEDNVLKVVDFGVSQMFEKKGEMRTSKSAGSPAFLPPELCGKHGDVSGTAADIWSMGVSLFCLKYGCIPFNREGMLEMYEAIKSEEVAIPDDENPLLKDLFSRILEKDPEKRITMPQLREHPWVTKEGTDPLLSTEENCAHNVEPPNELEINRAFTRKMNHLLYVMKVLQRFKGLLAKKRRERGQGDGQPVSVEDAPRTSTEKVTMEDPSFNPAVEKAKAEEIEALLEKRRHVQSLSQSQSRSRSRSESIDERQRALNNDPAYDPGDQEHAPLFLGIGTGTRGSSSSYDDEGPNVVADSPTAVEFDVYDRAYGEAVEKLRSRQQGRPTVYLTRFVKDKAWLEKLKDQLGESEGATAGGIATTTTTTTTTSGGSRLADLVSLVGLREGGAGTEAGSRATSSPSDAAA